MWWSYIRYGVDYDEYRIFEFYSLPGFKRDTYMSKCRHQNLENYLCDVKHLVILNNRTKFYIKFKDVLNREYYNVKELSFKEFELLTYFMENKGIALSREKILNSVWNYDYFGDARTIDTHVKKLRSKMGDKGDMIKTVWGMGYKFE